MCPGAKLRATSVAHVCSKCDRRAAIVATLACKEVVVVERIEEVRLKSEVDLFGDPRVLGERDVKVLEAGPVNRGHGLTGSRVTKSAEVCFKRVQVEVSAVLCRIESVASMRLHLGSRLDRVRNPRGTEAQDRLSGRTKHRTRTVFHTHTATTG